MVNRVAYIIGFGAPPVLQLHALVDIMIAREWDCYVVLSPTAGSWVDIDHLAATSRHPVRVEPRKPGDPDPLPPADAIVAAPLTFNSLNKWAQGHSDTLALGLLNEALGLEIPITAGIWAKPPLRRHPAFGSSIATLEAAGVRIVVPDMLAEQDGDGERAAIRWEAVAPPTNQSGSAP